ncbi:TIGR03085 family metal-binding protein [Spongiactinospora sp. TRM90649]|uniref:TIGR03085 family metal-binding protein n=1 Tax=Spongiactinospora sp. TRM90649 TaxID=3031114 RepID=UPI0023F88454|nr:TIGR03085 family metal-binding protein [Spongiactinospora sp. TRM90649]MDF5755993.1 TIGR03085 family metal-binding protein [Spongiactinospora sp. TRM90649]
MNYARTERAALSDLLERLGPDAPTLCAGWTTFDLAAHLVLRERRLDAAGGIAIKALAPYTASVQESLKKKHGYAGLIRLVREGPGGVYGLVPGADEAVNGVEFFVHHEDVRRAQPGWQPRELPDGQQRTLWKRLARMSRLVLRRAPVGVVLHRLGGGVALGGDRDAPHVEVTGQAAELLLFCMGRQEHARVDLSGDEAGIARLKGTHLGM